MWIKRTVVKVSVADCEKTAIACEFPFSFTSLTQVDALLRKAYRKCHPCSSYDMECSNFYVCLNGELRQLELSGRVAKLYKYLGCNGEINLTYIFGYGIGGFFDEDNDVVFTFHTKESRHVPHVHASYQGDEISIDILTLRVKGSFKNGKRQRKAIRYVRENRGKFLEAYNEKTNGIHVLGFSV